MKDNYNIKHNPPPLCSEDINKHKDFGALLEKFNQNGGYEEGVPSRGGGPSQLWVKYVLGGALALISAIGLLYLLQQNQTNQETKAFLEPPLALDVPFEEVEVNALKGDSLKFSSGAMLIIPPNALLGEDGEAVKGTVTLAYRDLSAPQAQLLAGVAETLDPEGHLQAANIFELRGTQDGKALTIDPQKPIQFIQNLEEDWPAITARHYHNNAWTVSTQLKIEGPDVSKDQPKVDMVKKLTELEKQIPKPAKPIKPNVIGEDMQPFDVDIKASEFPELLHYAEIIWVAPKKEVKDEWFEVEWDNMSIERKGELEYEFVFEKGTQRITVEALPQVPYSQRAMQAYEKALETYNKAIESRKLKIQEELETWMADQKGENPVGQPAKTKYELMIEEFGLWTLGQLVKPNDLPEHSFEFESKAAELINPQQIFVANSARKIFYRLPAKAPYAIDIENSQVWVIDDKGQLWKHYENSENKIYLDYSSAEKLLEALKGELN